MVCRATESRPAEHGPFGLLRVLSAAVIATSITAGLWKLHVIWSTVEPDGYTLAFRKLVYVDFTNLWAGGLLARSNELSTLFDESAYRLWLQARFTGRYEDSEWSYPPTMLLLGAPLSWLSLPVAYWAWAVGTALALGYGLRRLGFSWGVAILSGVSPGVWQSVAFGQNGALTALLLIAALTLTGRANNAAGLAAGLLTVKPQMGLLIPVAYAASGSWRAFLTATLTSICLALMVTLAFGTEAWMLFWTRTRPLMVSILEAPWGEPRGYHVNSISTFVAARAWNISVGLAYTLQAIVTVAAVWVTWKSWKMRGVDCHLRLALTIAMVLLATPYGYHYDMVALSVASAILLQRNGWIFKPVVAIAWIWPSISSSAGSFGLILSPFLLAAFAWSVYRQLVESTRVSRPACV